MGRGYIICVDDEKIVLSCLEQQLKYRFGMEYNIETANCGYEALQIFKNLKKNGEKIPVFISDYVMPDIDGAELLEYIYVLSPETKLILISGYITLERIKNVVNKANLFRCIEKPWSRRKLYEAVNQAVLGFEESRLVNNKSYQTLAKKNKHINKSTYDDLLEKIIKKLDTASNIGTDMNNITINIKNSIKLIKSSLEIVNSSYYNKEEFYNENLKIFYNKISELIGNVINNFEFCIKENQNYKDNSEDIFNVISQETNNVYANLVDKVNNLIDKIDNKETEMFSINNENIVAWIDGEIFIIKIDSVLLFCSDKSDIIAVTKDNKYKIKKSLDNLESDYKGRFFRCHRSFLVNLNCISKISPWIANNSYILRLNYYSDDIPISRDRIKEMKKILGIKK